MEERHQPEHGDDPLDVDPYEPQPEESPSREPYEPTPSEDEGRTTTSAPDEPLPPDDEAVRQELGDRNANREDRRTGDETLARLEEQGHDPGTPMRKPRGRNTLRRIGEEPPIPGPPDGGAGRAREARRTLGATRATVSVAAQVRMMATRARQRLRRR